MNTATDRRRYPRHSALFSAKYTVKEGKFRDLISDIGAGGVFVSTRRKINHGRLINLQFPILAFQKRFNVMGAVVRCDSRGFAVRFDEPVDEDIFKASEREPRCAEDLSDSENLKN